MEDFFSPFLYVLSSGVFFLFNLIPKMEINVYQIIRRKSWVENRKIRIMYIIIDDYK